MTALDPPASVRRLGWLRGLSGLGRAQDYLVTFVTEFATMGCTLIAFKLATVHWGTAGFGEYVLARRTLSLLQLPLLCGMGVAVTRYVARARTEGRNVDEHRYFVGGTAVSLFAVVFAGAILNAAPGPVAALLLGSSGYAPLVRALSLAVAGLALHGVAYGMLRGRVAMGQANALQAVNMAAVPLVALAVPHLTVTQVLTLMGTLWSFVSSLVVAAVLREAPAGVWSWPGTAGAVRRLLAYGAPRVPGEFALGALFTLPVTLAVHNSGVTMAGFVGLGVSLLTAMGSLFAPLGQIVLPAISARAVGRERHRIEGETWRLTGLCVAIGGVGTAVVELLAEWLIPRFLGPDFVAAVPVVRIMAFGAVPYIAYIVLRNVLDALHTTPLNAKNLIVALGIFLAGSIVAPSPMAVPVSLTAGLIVLGGLSALDAHRALARLEER